MQITSFNPVVVTTDPEATIKLLEDHGFKNVLAAPVTDSSSKSISMISPSGFTIGLVEHIRK